MKKTELQPKEIFFPTVKVVANGPVPDGKDEEQESQPTIECEAFVPDFEQVFANVAVTWGKENSSNLYAIEIVCFGAFLLPQPGGEVIHPGDVISGPTLASLAANAVHILYGAAREHICAITARAPHGSLLLPAVLITENEVTLRLADEVAEKVDPVGFEKHRAGLEKGAESPKRRKA